MYFAPALDWSMLAGINEKINGHRELTVSSPWPRWSRLWGPMITAQSRLGDVTAQSRRVHSSVTARSQLSHDEVTAQSRHLQYDHGSVTARSQLSYGPGHGSVTAGCDHFGHRELTVSSPWAVTVVIYFLMGSPDMSCDFSKISLLNGFNFWHLWKFGTVSLSQLYAYESYVYAIACMKSWIYNKI